MRYHGIPSEEIDFYIFLKINPKTYIGYLKIMRLTGEGPTFDANTACNIAFDHTKYNIPKECAKMYAGDDSAKDQVCNEKSSWPLIEPYITLKAKPEVTPQPTFCGWKITKEGVIRDPFKLWFSYKRAKDKGNTSEVAVAYRHDILPAYKLGDKLVDILTESDLEFHRQVCRSLHVEDHIIMEGNKITMDSVLDSNDLDHTPGREKEKKKRRLNKKERARLVKLPLNSM
uniref:RNA helicase n=1 Tax=Insect-associated alphaflexivirus 3 TaxID=2692390 RepID=A0A6B9KXR2_9VIRU|nr:replicase [Insect-associated alphaflexivirus 3]